MPWAGISMTFLMIVGVLLILIILLQRGRGGGLVGAFGGMGGQSAFGTKAGDVFTKITVVLAVIWVVLAGICGFALRAGAQKRFKQDAAVAPDEKDSVDKKASGATSGKTGKKKKDAAADNGSKKPADKASIDTGKENNSQTAPSKDRGGASAKSDKKSGDKESKGSTTDK